MATPAVRRDVVRMILAIRNPFVTAGSRSTWVTLDPSLTTAADERGMLFRVFDRAGEVANEKPPSQFPDLTLIPQNGTVDLSLLNETLWENATSLMSPGLYTDPNGHPMLYRLHEDRHDFSLMPYALTQPAYHVDAPASLKFGGLGSQVALAFFELLFRDQQIEPTTLDTKLGCFLDAALVPMESAIPLEARMDILIRAASLGVLWLAFKLETANLEPQPIVELTSISSDQLLFIMWCHMQCGDPFAEFTCNMPLRHSTRFPDAFSCPQGSFMRSSRSCDF